MEACQQEVTEIEDADEIEGGIFRTENLTGNNLVCIRCDKWLNDKVLNKYAMSPASRITSITP